MKLFEKLLNKSKQDEREAKLIANSNAVGTTAQLHAQKKHVLSETEA